MIRMDIVLPNNGCEPLGALQAAIGAQLRQALDPVVRAPCPPELLAKLQALDRKSGHEPDR